MWQSCEGKVEVVLDLRLLQSWWFVQSRPYPCQILYEGIPEVCKGCSAKVIAYNKEQ